MPEVPIIAVTGTKGKTTVVSVVDMMLRQLGHNTVRVDTTGHSVNGKKKSTLDDSKKIWHLVPTKAPGRYLWEFHANTSLLEHNPVAVLECAIGCSTPSGLGYRYHNVGLFLNVFEDHIGGSDRINSRRDIAEAKSFIFQQITGDYGYAVFNADDALVVEMLHKYANHVDPSRQIAVGLNFDQLDRAEHLGRGGIIVTVDADRNIIVQSSDATEVVVSLDKVPWTFNGAFEPSVWNCMFSVAAIYALYDGMLPVSLTAAAESVRLDEYSGRLTALKAKSGTKIIADYAHEKQSLAAIARLARTQIEKEGRVIGVVRMAYDRPDAVFTDTGAVIGEEFDDVIVYEKIDGYWRMPEKTSSKSFVQEVGRTSKLVYGGVKSTNDNVVRIEREDEAVAHAATIANPEDIVVVIVNDDIKRSIDFVQRSFEAVFV